MVKKKNAGRFFAAIGGAFVGMISVGLAELQEYHLMSSCKVPPHVAVATTVFVVVITAIARSVSHFYGFIQEVGEILNKASSIVLFTIPGVIIGGQIGPRLQSKIPEDIVKGSLSILILIIGMFMLWKVAQ